MVIYEMRMTVISLIYEREISEFANSEKVATMLVLCYQLCNLFCKLVLSLLILVLVNGSRSRQNFKRKSEGLGILLLRLRYTEKKITKRRLM